MSDFELPADWQDHPMVKELIARLTELSTKVEAFEAQKLVISSQIKDVKKDKQAFVDEYAERLKQFDSKIQVLSRQEYTIDNEFYNLKKLQESMRSEVGDFIMGLEAQAELAVAQAAWEEILQDQDWLWIKSIFEYQKVGSEFITSGLKRDLFGILLADQMGLGKTLQATAAINLIQYTDDFEKIVGPRCPRLRPPVEIDGDPQYDPSWYSVLWVCPNAIKAASMREIAKWSSDLNVIKLEGNKDERNNIVKIAHNQGMVLVVSYEQLRQRKGEDLTPALFDYDWPIVVMDEAHKFKNEDSSTFQAIERVCKNAGYVIPMTGTPIMNRPEEFWAILHMITLKGKYEGKFDLSWKFEAEYLNTWGGKSEFKYGGYDKLVNTVSDMVLRRRKDEVLLDLPDKIREVRFVELQGKQRDLYNELRDKLFIWLDEQKSDFISTTSILAQLTRLRQIALLPAGVVLKDPDGTNERHLDCWESAKIDEALGLIEELMEADEKVLVFSNYNEPLKYLAQQIRDRGYEFEGRPVDTGLIMGGVHETKRDEISHRFNQEDDTMRVVCGNIAAMGIGLNLQGACSHAIFLDLGWNPGVNEQAEDRLHRQGQKNSVTIHIIQAEDTVDGFIAAKLEEKAELIEGVIERSELRNALNEGLI